MPTLNRYRQILPDWSALRAFEQDEREAVAELIVTLSQLGGLTAESAELAALKASWVELFCEPDWLARATFEEHVKECERRIRPLLAHPGAYDTLLVSACSRLRAPTTQFHSLCVAIATVLLSTSTQEQTRLVYRLGDRFNLGKARIDELFARMRSTTERTRSIFQQ